jgi:hypothetical protein
MNAPYRVDLPEQAKAIHQFLPPSLENLSMSFGTIPLQHAHYLPRKLRRLPNRVALLGRTPPPDLPGLSSIFIPGSTTPQLFFDLALNFPELTHYDFLSTNDATSTLAFHFPNTLTDLKLVLSYSHVLPNSPHAFATVNTGRWPLSLLSLDYHDAYFPSDDGIAGLPPGLTSLRLSRDIRPTYGENASVGELTATGLSNLPPNLKRLEIPSSINHISSVFFWLLPRGLVDLDLPNYDEIADDDIARLPRTITRLALRNSTKLSDAAMADLPPSIHRIDMRRNRKMTVAIIPLLPRSLVWLDLRKNPNFPKRFKVPPWLHLKTKFISDGW